MAKCYFKAVKNNKNFDFFQNVISVATLIRAYLDEKPSEINTRSYMFIRKCRVDFSVFETTIFKMAKSG